MAEGHKALVFSQFTAFLALLRERLDEAAFRTSTSTAACAIVRRASTGSRTIRRARSFSSASRPAGTGSISPRPTTCSFSIRGGIRRSKRRRSIARIASVRRSRVIATRIVARDTIEEKILELQASKRALADAILGQDQGVLAQIGREELEMLLG